MTNVMLITLLGGMALLLYGMQLVGEGLQHAAGGRIGRSSAPSRIVASKG